MLFDGGSTIQIDLGQRYLFDDQGGVDARPHRADRCRLGRRAEVRTTGRRPGLLQLPQTTATPARAWVQFPRPRRISVDEMIAADLLAQFRLAVDRLVTAQQAAEREANLQVALESHRLSVRPSASWSNATDCAPRRPSTS